MEAGKTCVVVVFEEGQISIHHGLLVEHGEHLLFGDQVVHEFGQGVGELGRRGEDL